MDEAFINDLEQKYRASPGFMSSIKVIVMQVGELDVDPAAKAAILREIEAACRRNSQNYAKLAALGEMVDAHQKVVEAALDDLSRLAQRR